MSNKLVYRNRVFTDANMVSGSTSRAQSLDMRELTVDSAQFVLRQNAQLEFLTAEPFWFFTRDLKRLFTSETASQLKFLTAEPLQFFTRDLKRLLTSEESIFDVVTQDEPIKQYVSGSQVAIWHPTEIERLNIDTYRITATSPLGLLLQRTHYGGIYTGQTVSSVASEIIGAGVHYYIEPEFRGIALYGWLPVANARENLLQMLFAINAALTTDEDGTLRIGNLSTIPSETVDAGDIYADGATVEYLTPITRVVVLEHNYTPGQDRETLFDGTAEENQIIQFGKPVANIEATGFTVIESGANYAKVSAGTGTLTGVPYIDMTCEVTADVTSAAVENEVRIEEATLAGVTAAPDVVRRLQDFYRHRKKIVISVADKRPWGAISAYEPYERKIVPVCVESASSALSAVEKTRISAVVDYSPWQTAQFEDVRVLLTGDGTWIAPEGATYVTAVLIGEGAPGESGSDGEPGETQSVIETGTFTRSFQDQKGGVGGAGGAGGLGGKIRRVLIPLGSASTFSYHAEHGDTTFGEYTSSSGESSATGYRDSITGEVFAESGDMGIPGADGGGGNSNGNAVDTWNGGAFGPSGSRSAGSTDSTAEYNGGGGGGAAYGANGGDAPFENRKWSSGGKGADAIQPPTETIYGKGGPGGNGGGGGGGTGGATVTARNGYGAWWKPNAAPGGKGSSGGNGGPGCIILYYRQPVTQ